MNYGMIENSLLDISRYLDADIILKSKKELEKKNWQQEQLK